MRLPVLFLASAALVAADARHIAAGRGIPGDGCAGQPCIVKRDDGAWPCVITTGEGREGRSGRHVISMRGTDHGRTWSKPAAVEPASGTEASYAVPLKVPSGRAYVFYNHNTDNVRRAIADKPACADGFVTRVGRLGHSKTIASEGLLPDAFELWCKRETTAPGQALASNRIADGRGFSIRTAPPGALERWGRYDPNLKWPEGAPRIEIAGTVARLRIRGRILRTSEAIAAWRAGP